jgi:uncharacterized protein
MPEREPDSARGRCGPRDRLRPDCVLDGATAEPITMERLRYRQRVAVPAVAEIGCTPQALAVFGPATFRLKGPHEPLETIPV